MLKIVFAASLLFVASISSAITFTDPGFTSETVVTLGSFSILQAAFAPDGRIFLLQKNGIIRIFKNGSLLPAPFLDISSQVNIVTDRGSLGIALDPNFSTNGYVYVGYVYEEAGNPTNQGPKVSRVSRFTADPTNPDKALANSEFILMGSISTPPCSNHPAGSDCMPVDLFSHSVGTLRFGPDGTLYISNGEGANYAMIDPNALRAQDLNSYSGKILRINPDGTAPPDNPFYQNDNSIKSKVWAYGFRNPFRFALDHHGEPHIFDVGSDAWEEINHGRGKNFGWPCYEGNSKQPLFQSMTQCQQLPAGSITLPDFTYDPSVGAAITGGAFNTGNQYPVQYSGNLFFSDYVGGWIRRATFDQNDNLDQVFLFASQAGAVVDIELGPDGFLYYIDINTGELRRIKFNGPFADATATSPASGYSPLTVNFSSAGSFDPQSLPLTFSWNFGDGTSSTNPNPSHQYTSATVATFNVVLTVTNSNNQSSTDSLTVTVGSLPPVATITAPADGSPVSIGQTVNYSGSATDPDDGNLPPSGLNWSILLHHNTHVHSFLTSTGTGGSFVVTDPGTGTFSYEFILTATDSSGLTDTDSHTTPFQTPGGCLFCDDFEDGTLATNWTFTPTWSETGGKLVSTATKKAKAIATPAFGGCALCTVDSDMTSAGGSGNKLSLLGWYLKKSEDVELLMKEESDKWILKQRFGGVTKKVKADLTIDPNVTYAVILSFDGTTFHVSVDGQEIITMDKIPGSSPSGTVGFQVKETTGSFGSIGVN